ncbi:MAG: hypothetical protein LBF83_07705 [Spirochaetaceae bacterium]|nr:hypothetical protein [Spirochaetaceae bacterium]
MKRIKFFSFALALTAMALVSGGCDTGGDGSGGGGEDTGIVSKPAQLLSNASYSQAVAKIAEIIAYCDAHPGENTGNLKSDSLTFISNITEDIWNEDSIAIINRINRMIDSLDGKTINVPSSTLANALDWVSDNAVSGNNYIITLTGNETIGPRTLSYNEKVAGVTIEGGAAERKISLSTAGSLFSVGSGVTLRLGNNVTLQGRHDNNLSLVIVYGTLVMQPGSRITGNKASSSNFGGGVLVVPGSIFIMNGGEISGNTGVNGTGGGVEVSYGIFIMNGGEISVNAVVGQGGAYGARGGGVSLSGAFIMNGGTISGNTASDYGGKGGGVHMFFNSTFTMNGGTISGNTAYEGGGVFVGSYGKFTKSGNSIIYGDTDNNPDNGNATDNTATTGNGHAVFGGGDDGYYVTPVNKRNTTAGPGVNLDSTKDDAAGGWE